ncbi:MAG: response regulator transcription factor [Elainellaceae cyanobacterium]
MIRVVVAARSAIVRAGLATLIGEQPTIAVVGTASDLDSLWQQIEGLQPEVVLFDAENPVDDLAGLADRQPLPPVLLLAEENDRSGRAEIWQLGVRGLLPKDAIASEIIAAIEAIAAGLMVWHPDLSEAAFAAAAPLAPGTAGVIAQPLTSREIEVLQMLAEGLGNKAIARRLEISEHTVKFHVSSIFSKLQVSSRTEAVIMGTRLGLVLL